MSKWVSLRTDFPLLVNKPDLVYLDSAATAQKPYLVIDALQHFYSSLNGPVRRGMYTLAEEATTAYEQARATVAQFIGVNTNEVVFTFGATDSINMVAYGWLLYHLKEGDEVVVSIFEHHANLLVWQDVCKRTGAVLKMIEMKEEGVLDESTFETLFTKKTKFLAISAQSHALGTVIPLKKLIAYARAVGAYVLVDACQAVPHMQFKVPLYEPDFVVFSGHKMMAPTGIGVLYIARHLHESVRPYRRGGGMVFSVTRDSVQWHEMPYRLEAGTPPVEHAYALMHAIKYLQSFDAGALHEHYKVLMKETITGLSHIKNIRILGSVDLLHNAHIVSFVHRTMHVHDIARLLDEQAICVRSGNFCAQPLAHALGINGALRVSFYLYSTVSDVSRLLEALEKVVVP